MGFEPTCAEHISLAGRRLNHSAAVSMLSPQNVEINGCYQFEQSKMESPGFEPGTLRMQSGCDTTTPQSHNVISSPGQTFPPLINDLKLKNIKGLFRELNPGPLAPKARIIPLDQTAVLLVEFKYSGCDVVALYGSISS